MTEFKLGTLKWVNAKTGEMKDVGELIQIVLPTDKTEVAKRYPCSPSTFTLRMRVITPNTNIAKFFTPPFLWNRRN